MSNIRTIRYMDSSGRVWDTGVDAERLAALTDDLMKRYWMDHYGPHTAAFMGAFYPNSNPQVATATGAKTCDKCAELEEKLARYEAVIDAAIAGAIPPVVRGMAAKAKHPEDE